MRLGIVEKAILSSINENESKAYGKDGLMKRLLTSYIVADINEEFLKFSKKSFREALKRLMEKGLIEPITISHEPIDVELIKKAGETRILRWLNIFRLTEEGIKIAEKLPKPKEILQEAKTKQKIKRTRKRMPQQVQEIASQLIEKQGYATASQIKQIAWKKYGNQYKNREVFEKTWSEDRIGKILRKLGFKRTRKGKKGERFWLTLPSKFPSKGNFSISVSLHPN